MNLNKETSNKSCQLNDFWGFIATIFFSKYKGLLNDLPKQATRNLSGINFQLNIQASFSSSYHGSL